MRSSPKRVVARLLDGRERRARLLGLLVEEVQGDAGLHVDERDVVGEHVVQLLRELQALLARLALARFLGEALLLGALLASHPHHLGDGEHEQQPSGDEREVQPPDAVRGAGIDHLCDEERDVPHAREDPRLAPTQLHPVVERDDDAQEDRAVRDIRARRTRRRRRSTRRSL